MTSTQENIVFTVFKGSKAGDIIQSETIRAPLAFDQVHVAITASGLCGGDLLFKGNDMVLGHEGVGIVSAIGTGVTRLQKGDRVGWGFLQDTCGNCIQCLDGGEVFCPERKMYGRADFDQGSLAYGIVKKESRLFKIPNEISDEEAAPLMCAGATVFSALSSVKATDRVGVIGVGGLGHLAIQFASRMGCDVVAFTNSETKSSDALSFGANACYTIQNLRETKIGRGLDMVLVTAPAQPDWSLYIPLLAPRAIIFPLTIGPGNIALPAMPVLLNGVTIQGSAAASRKVHLRMLAFAAQHGVKPMIQRFSMDKEGIEEAFIALKEGKMRYRGVLVVPIEKRLA
ncbi:hypothetical protein HYFRA_00000650 [Hymenoscyphus fraxineus]|uniref:Enoyl reductase (ER) domain-containing protein n=1 Tax=Hymenoscyphus fraxineus TaxID=746836 RepID=A0A9N9PWH0_9HELO|nr:hypothetical protein HYFRA_00000650 [Hymenoscyphus fraxineus]